MLKKKESIVFLFGDKISLMSCSKFIKNNVHNPFISIFWGMSMKYDTILFVKSQHNVTGSGVGRGGDDKTGGGKSLNRP